MLNCCFDDMKLILKFYFLRTFVPSTDEEKEKEDKKDEPQPVSFLKLVSKIRTTFIINILF